MRSSLACLAGAFILATTLVASAASEPASQPADLPQYKFTVGQELVYESTGAGESGTDLAATESQWRLWITGGNATSGWDVVIHFKHTLYEGAKSAASTMGQSTVVTGKIQPDGRIEFADATVRRVAPTLYTLFVQLPADKAAAEKGYAFPIDGGGSARVTVLPHTAKSWQFHLDCTGDDDAVYELKRTREVTFDAEKGLVSAIEATETQNYGIKSKMTSKIVLKQNEIHDAEWTKDAAKDSELVTMAITKYWEEINTASRGPTAEVERHVGTAFSALEMASSMAATDEVKSFLDEQLKRNEVSFIRSLQRSTAERDKFVGQAAPDWTLEKVAGGNLALKDLRGKVVVLDFWYRGCGYCIQAMPQMRQLADDFKKRDVVILGMNIDRDVADAKLVIEKMKLNYDSVRAPQELPDKYGVQGYPTLVIIDKKGIIRELHIGYSPTLRKDVTETVEKLLKE